jgi:hypothetical protein
MARGVKKDEDSKSGDQIENLRDELLPAQQAEDPKKPRIPFKTSYVLTRDQEDALVEHAILRMLQLEIQLGRKIKESGSTGRGQGTLRTTIDNPHSFIGKREKYTLRYYNHVEDRIKPDTIYEHSNLTASLSQRITKQMVASTAQFFFGKPDDTDWFSTSAVGAEDETLSEKIKKHSRWKLDQPDSDHKRIKDHFIEGLEFAFVRGEAVIKTTHQERSQIYKRTATILMGGIDNDGDDASGKPSQDEPLLDANGDYIVQGDSFVPEMGPPNPGIIQKVKQFFTGPEPGAVDQSGQPTAPEQQMVPTGGQVLKRDGVTQLPPVPIWKEQVITRKLVTAEGPEAAVVYYKDFLCPEDATSVQQADLIAQLYDKNAMQIAEMFRGQYGEGDEAIDNMTAAVERLRAMLGETNIPKSATSQPREDFKETDTTGAVGVPIVEVAEVYLTYDADGDGIQEEIMLVLDRKNKAPIYYEYLANVTVRGLRPFYVWRPMSVDGRWYGFGSMEFFDPEQEFIDLQINRHNFATSSAGMVTFWEPSATVEGSRDPNLKLGHGKTYTKRNTGQKTEEILSYVKLPTDEENLQYLIDLFMQAMQLKSGKINPGDQKMSGLPSSETATGENIVMETGDELFSLILSSLFPGVKGALQAVVEIIYANMNRVEVFSFFNGEADEILSLDPGEVRDMALNVTLELSRTQQEKALQQGDRATNLIGWFYGLPFQLQQRVSNYARQTLKGLGVSQADKVIDPVDLSAGQPSQKVGESLNYKDAPPDIKRQIEGQAGLQPSTAETAEPSATTGAEASAHAAPPPEQQDQGPPQSAV